MNVPVCRSDQVLRMNSETARHFTFTSEQIFEDMRANPNSFVLFFSREAMAALNSPHVR